MQDFNLNCENNLNLIEEEDKFINNSKSSKEQQNEQIKEFELELFFYNNIYGNDEKNPNKAEQTKEYTEKETLTIDLPITKKINEEFNSVEDEGDNDFYFIIGDLVDNLKKKGYPLISTSELYIFIDSINEYTHVTNKNNFITLSMLENNKIKLKIKNNLANSLLENSFLLMKKFFKNILEKKKLKSITSRKRKLKNIIKLVYKSRKLFNGFVNEEGIFVKYSLEKAASIVGIPVKTLQDYLRLIRFAREAHFDFNKNKDKTISFLRKYLKRRGLIPKSSKNCRKKPKNFGSR
jgi:hypothetical protein